MAEPLALRPEVQETLRLFLSQLRGLVASAQPTLAPLGNSKSWATPSKDMEVATTVLMTAGSSINQSVTKFSLLYATNPPLTAAESLNREMMECCSQMVSALDVLGHVGSSPPMVRHVGANIRALLHSLEDMVGAVAAGRGECFPSLTGVVWEACKQLLNSPKSNKLGCCLDMVRWSLALKDTIDEFQTALDNATRPSTSQAGADGDDPEPAGHNVPTHEDDAAEFDDFADLDEPGDYSLEEAAVVRPVLELLKITRRGLKVASDTLNTLPEPAEGEEQQSVTLTWAYQVYGHLEKLQEQAVELGFGLYPPIDAQACRTKVEEYVKHLAAALDELCTGSCVKPAAKEVAEGLQSRLAEAATSAAQFLSVLEES